MDDLEASVFMVTTRKEFYALNSVTSLTRNQDKLEIRPDEPALITVTDEKVKRYKRYGLNQNEGKSYYKNYIVTDNR